MKKLKKLLVALLAATLMVSALPLSASAAAIENEVMPLWDNTNQISSGILFDDGYGYAEAMVVGKFGTTNITIDIYVYYLSDGEWVYLTELHDSVQSMSTVSSCQFESISGYSYKADYTITVTKGGIAEEITKTDTQTCP